LGVWLFYCSLTTWAGPPFVTDDPEPVAYQHWELYLASQHIETADGWSGTAPHIELNYGVVTNLARQGIAYVPFFPLGGFTPLQSTTLSAVASQLGVKPMQVALAWLLHRSPNMLLIPGTSSVAHLRENLAAGRLTLSPQTLEELDGIAAVIAAPLTAT
jgi:hypothetical protein